MIREGQDHGTIEVVNRVLVMDVHSEGENGVPSRVIGSFFPSLPSRKELMRKGHGKTQFSFLSFQGREVKKMAIRTRFVDSVRTPWNRMIRIKDLRYYFIICKGSGLATWSRTRVPLCKVYRPVVRVLEGTYFQVQSCPRRYPWYGKSGIIRGDLLSCWLQSG